MSFPAFRTPTQSRWGAAGPLARFTPPSYPFQTAAPAPRRPLGVVWATTMTVTAAMLSLCVTGGLWLLSTVGRANLDRRDRVEGVVFELFRDMENALRGQVFVPLLVLSLAAVVLVFPVAAGKRWARIAFTVAGVATVAWLVWWLQSWTALAPGLFVAFCVALLWLPACRSWFATRPRQRS